MSVSVLSLTAALALGACARGPSPTTWDAAAHAPEQRPTVHFQNEARRYVDVYLIGATRQWWLGRVAPGANRLLPIPTDAAAEASAGNVRLAVLEGATLSMQAALDPRATLTIAQPAMSMLSQRWTFRSTQFASPEILGAR
jgi:hypothetical protein